MPQPLNPNPQPQTSKPEAGAGGGGAEPGRELLHYPGPQKALREGIPGIALGKGGSLLEPFVSF